MLFCFIAIRFPTDIEIALKTAIMPAQSEDKASFSKTVYRILRIMANPTALLATDRNPVMGVGAPSYTSGAHI